MGLSNKVLILAKVESAYGTDSSPIATTNAILAGSLDLTPIQGDSVQRNLIRPYFGNVQSTMVTTYASASFEVELAASGVAGTAPQLSPLLRACGFAVNI